MIKEFQHRIEEEIKKFSSELSIPPSELYDPIQYMLSLGGKRIRPLFVLMACDLFEGNIENVIPSAMAVELFHNFTLVHDDIIDNAPLRRNKQTVHTKWNTNIAILSGDVMMIKAYQLIGRSRLSPQIFDSVLFGFNEMAIKVCEGQQWDLNFEQFPIEQPVSIQQYLEMIELKTAVLIAESMRIGALIGGANTANAANIYEFGKNIGMAFQLQDDLLDVYGEEKKFGKQNGGDIISNKKTFLLLKASKLVLHNHYLKEELDQWMSVHPSNEKDAIEKVKAITRIYDFVNIKKITEEEIQSFHQKALASLDKVNSPVEKKTFLLEFITGLLKREN